MPILMPTQIVGRVKGLYVNSSLDIDLESTSLDEVTVTYEGFDGEDHGGLTRKSCSRVKLQYKKGTEIRNTRQISILSREELEAVAVEMGLEKIEPEWVGTNLIIEGIPVLTQLPPSSRLIFDSGVSLVVDMENGPCRFASEQIDLHCPGKGGSFAKLAKGRRGVTAWVEKIGVISLEEGVRLHVPPQRIYYPAIPASDVA